jgi:hypothetical protein
MIFASLITVIFVFMAFYSFVFVRRVEVRYLLLLVYSLAILFAWKPELSTAVAHFFGIGRGLDFALMLFSVAIVNGMFFIVGHLNSQYQSITKLTRHIAIQESRRPSSGSNDELR